MIPDPVELDGTRAARPTVRVIRAAAVRIDISDKREMERNRRLRQEWMNLAWTYHDLIPEVRFAARYVGNSQGRLRYTVGVQENPMAPVYSPEEAKALKVRVPASLVAAAEEELARLDRGVGLLSLQQTMGVSHFVTGDCHLVGSTVNGEEEWHVYSDAELVVTGEGYQIKLSPYENPEPLDPNAAVIRMWRPHDRWHRLADSNMRSVLLECDELLMLARSFKAAAKSRLGAGILFAASELDFGRPQEDQSMDPSDGEGRADPFTEELIEAMTTPIADEASASAVVPLIVRGPADLAEKALKKIDLGRLLDPEALPRAKFLLDRLANGLDVPREVITGVADVNHWTAFAVTAESYQAHIEPNASVSAWGIASGFLRPALTARAERDGEKWTPEDIAKVAVLIDPSGLISKQQRTQNAIQAHQLLIISDRAARDAMGFNENDAPTDEELVRRLAIRQHRLDPAATAEILNSTLFKDIPALEIPAPAGGLLPTHPGQGPGQPPLAPVQEQGPPDQQNPGDVAKPGAPQGQNEKRPVQAAGVIQAIEDATYRAVLRAAAIPAASTPVDRELERLAKTIARMDRGVLARVLTTADLAARRALERAGAKLRSTVQGNAKVKRQIAQTCNADLWSAHPEVFAAVGIDVHDAIQAAIDEYGIAVDAILTAAQLKVLEMLRDTFLIDDSEWDDTQQQFDRARSAAVIWLTAALVALVTSKLSGQTEQQMDRVRAGEVPLSAVVPASMVREAVAIAGGAQPVEGPNGGLTTADGDPVQGIAAGPIAQAVMAHHRVVQTGWVWDYGDISERRRPFEPHVELDGIHFTDWTDAALATSEDSAWLGERFFPGDHDGCLCTADPVFQRH